MLIAKAPGAFYFHCPPGENSHAKLNLFFRWADASEFNFGVGWFGPALASRPARGEEMGIMGARWWTGSRSSPPSRRLPEAHHERK